MIVQSNLAVDKLGSGCSHESIMPVTLFKSVGRVAIIRERIVCVFARELAHTKVGVDCYSDFRCKVWLICRYALASNHSDKGLQGVRRKLCVSVKKKSNQFG